MEVISKEIMARGTVDRLGYEGYKLIGSYIVGAGSDPAVLDTAAAGKLPKDSVVGPLFLKNTYYPLGAGFYKKAED